MKTIKIPELEEAMAKDPPRTLEHQWTDEEEEIIKTYYRKVKQKYLANHLKVSINLLGRKVAEMRARGDLPP